MNDSSSINWDAISAVLLSVTILFAVYQMRKEYNWRKREKTMTYASYDNDALLTVFRRIEKYLGTFRTATKPIPIDEIKEAIDASKQEDKEHSLDHDLSYVLDRFSVLGLSVERGIADFDTAWFLVGSSARHQIMVLSEYIKYKRESENRPTTWENAVHFALRIKRAQDAERESGLRSERIEQIKQELIEASEQRKD